MKWRTQYDVEADEDARLDSAIHCEDETRTVQDYPDTDINELMRKFGVTDGSTLPTNLGIPIDASYYGDFSEIPDLRQAIENTQIAKDRFMALPASLRAEFDNDPYSLYLWVTDPRNGEEAVKKGLLSKLAEDPNGASAPDPKTPA